MFFSAHKSYIIYSLIYTRSLLEYIMDILPITGDQEYY